MSVENINNLYLSDLQFEEAIRANDLVLVDFFAPWCGPCRVLSPIIEELAHEYTGKIAIYKMNIDENSVTPTKYAVRSIPTLILFKQGQPIERLVGALSKVTLKQKLDFHI